MTYKELLEKAEKNGMKLAAVALCRMMDIVEEETGVWPNLTDEAPEWVIKNFGFNSNLVKENKQNENRIIREVKQ